MPKPLQADRPMGKAGVAQVEILQVAHLAEVRCGNQCIARQIKHAQAGHPGQCRYFACPQVQVAFAQSEGNKAGRTAQHLEDPVGE
ncbi:hypothetical protein D3C84_1024740 [compost metagenome]